MMESVSYLKGLAEGLGIDDSTKEGKLLSAIVDVLDDMAAEIADIEETADEQAELLDIIDEDLGSLEEDFYGDGEEDDECGCDDDLYEVCLLYTSLVAGARQEDEYLALCEKKASFGALADRIIVLRIDVTEVSSTEIRARLAAGEQPDESQLPKEVLAYIMKRGLYQPFSEAALCTYEQAAREALPVSYTHLDVYKRQLSGGGFDQAARIACM